MKIKELVLLIIGLFFSLNLNAQNELKIGVNAGMTYPDIRGHEYAKYNNFKLGYLLGVTFDYYLTEDLSLKANVNYERKIKKLEVTYYDYEAEETGKQSFREIYEYINLPVLLKYEFVNSGFFVNGGPFVNYLLNYRIKPNGSIDESNVLTEQKKIDFGLSAGIGTIIALNEKNDLTIEIRDDLGLIDTGGVPKHVGGTVKTNVIKLILGWNLGI